MANERELNGKNDYFEYVESRIESLEKLILTKDEELKSLILTAAETNHLKKTEADSEQTKKTMSSKGKFDQVFQDIKEEETRFLKKGGEGVSYQIDELDQQLINIEDREKMVQEMLDSLEMALQILKQRHEEVNRKEETLNQEYKKLLEIEALYANTSDISQLETSFSQFSLDDQQRGKKEKGRIRNGEE